MYHRELALLLSGVGHRYCRKRVVLGIVVGSTAVVVVILTFPSCLKKSSGGFVEVEVLIAGEAWTVTDTQPGKLLFVQKIRAYESTGQVTFIVR